MIARLRFISLSLLLLTSCDSDHKTETVMPAGRLYTGDIKVDIIHHSEGHTVILGLIEKDEITRILHWQSNREAELELENGIYSGRLVTVEDSTTYGVNTGVPNKLSRIYLSLPSENYAFVLDNDATTIDAPFVPLKGYGMGHRTTSISLEDADHAWQLARNMIAPDHLGKMTSLTCLAGGTGSNACSYTAGGASCSTSCNGTTHYACCGIDSNSGPCFCVCRATGEPEMG